MCDKGSKISPRDLFAVLSLKFFYSHHWTGHGGRIGKAQNSHMGDRAFESSQVKQMTYKNDTCRFLARCSVLLE